MCHPLRCQLQRDRDVVELVEAAGVAVPALPLPLEKSSTISSVPSAATGRWLAAGKVVPYAPLESHMAPKSSSLVMLESQSRRRGGRQTKGPTAAAPVASPAVFGAECRACATAAGATATASRRRGKAVVGHVPAADLRIVVDCVLPHHHAREDHHRLRLRRVRGPLQPVKKT